MSVTLNSIPASFYVNDTPSVLSAGGAGLALNELMLTTSFRPPIGAVLSSPDLASVQAFFGAGSIEAIEAAIYFAGFDNSTIKPGALLFAQYPITAVSAYLRGGNIAAVPLSAFQAVTAGTLNITVNGSPISVTAINLSAATSLTQISQIISSQAAGSLGIPLAQSTASSGASASSATGSGTNLTLAGVTGVIHPGTINSAPIAGTNIPGGTFLVSQTSGATGGAGVYVTNQPTTASGTAATVTSNVLDVTAIIQGIIAVGDQTVASGFATFFVAAQLTGTPGGVGTYQLNAVPSGVRASGEIDFYLPFCTYDTISGAFTINSGTTGAASTIAYPATTLASSIAPLFEFTLATGGVLSQGSAAAVPGTFMAQLIAGAQNWATFQTLFDPDAGSGNAQKQLFAAWVNSTNNRYAYLATDTDITPTQSANAAASLGRILKSTNSSGTIISYQPVGGANHLSAFVGGAIASIDFSATNGRTTLDYRSQTGLVPSVTNAAVAANLLANGYNYYGSVAAATEIDQFYDNGQISGPFAWVDSYINQIRLNSQCQLALLNLLRTLRSIPYNPVGYGYIRQTLTGGAQTPVTLPPASPVAEALNFGTIRQNVPLSAEQAVAVNALAGQKVDEILATQGWYLVIQPATAQVRAQRQSPTIILLYMDGQSIQRINLSSVLVQ